MADSEKLSRGLAAFSFGLGLVEILAPRALAKAIGVRNHRVLPALGAREIVSGFALMAEPRRAAWAWSRVGGDAMDLSILGKALADTAGQGGAIAATVAVAGVTALDVLCATRLAADFPQSQGLPRKPAPDAWMAVTIDRSPEECYRFWRDFENLPRIMAHLEEVRAFGDGTSLWRAKAPGGTTVTWNARITDDRPNELIAWRSVEGSEVQASGSVTFMPAPAGRGAIVRAQMAYNPPGGILGKAVAKLSSESPARQLYESLRAFKQVMEVGEVLRSDATLRGQAIGQRPARPLPEAKAA